jgi:hypothetical protein
MLELAGSLEMTVTFLMIFPDFPWVTILTLIFELSPFFKIDFSALEAVHPQLPFTLRIRSRLSPSLVNLNSVRMVSPSFTVPKS